MIFTRKKYNSEMTGSADDLANDRAKGQQNTICIQEMHASVSPVLCYWKDIRIEKCILTIYL